MFIAPMRLREEQVMVFQHRPQATFLPQKEKTKGESSEHEGYHPPGQRLLL